MVCGHTGSVDPSSSPALPFELVFRGATWHGRWVAEKLGVVVGGTPARPDPALLATARDVIARWPEHRQAIATFVRGLAADHHVPLDPPTLGGFAARTCGFGGELAFEAIAVTEVAAPRRVLVTFYTGYPDGYATFEVVLEHGTPTAVSAFAS